MKRNDMMARLVSIAMVWNLFCLASTGILCTVEEAEASGFRMDDASFLGENAND
jgi:hypothetical protein